MARAERQQAREKRHGVREIEAEGGDGDDGGETLVAREIEAVQRHLDQHAQYDGVHGHVEPFVDGLEDAAEREAAVAREGPQGPRPFCHQAVGAHEDDDGDGGCQECGGGDGAGAVGEDLDHGDPGGRGGDGGDVGDAEERGDEEDEACYGADLGGGVSGV